MPLAKSDFTLPELLAHVRPVQQLLGVKFQNEKFLLQALTHRSFLNETRVSGLEHNERLEFLGDAVIEYAITKQLYRRFSGIPEGQLTNFRALLVNAKVLASFAERLKLAPYLIASRGEAVGWQCPNGAKVLRFIMANVFEALVGAIHEDRGFGIAELFVSDIISPQLAEIAQKGITLDSRSALQDVAQARLSITPHYRVVSETGPDHDRWFVIECLLGEQVAGRGEGSSKDEAKTAAATDGLKKIFDLKVEDLRVQIATTPRADEANHKLRVREKK